MERNYKLFYDSHIKNIRTPKCSMFISSCKKIERN